MNCIYESTGVPDWLRKKYERMGCECFTCQARHMRICIKSRPTIMDMHNTEYDPFYEELSEMMAQPGPTNE